MEVFPTSLTVLAVKLSASQHNPSKRCKNAFRTRATEGTAGQPNALIIFISAAISTNGDFANPRQLVLADADSASLRPRIERNHLGVHNLQFEQINTEVLFWKKQLDKAVEEKNAWVQKCAKVRNMYSKCPILVV